MDRFIAHKGAVAPLTLQYLKSNMDRFIGIISSFMACEFIHLKSNMDRFIVVPGVGEKVVADLFKIQYG